MDLFAKFRWLACQDIELQKTSNIDKIDISARFLRFLRRRTYRKIFGPKPKVNMSSIELFMVPLYKIWAIRIALQK